MKFPNFSRFPEILGLLTTLLTDSEISENVCETSDDEQGDDKEDSFYVERVVMPKEAEKVTVTLRIFLES